MNRILSLALLAGVVSACATVPATETALTQTAPKYDVFPAARGLNRAEDGVVLADGRIVVGDQKFGLSVIAKDQSVRPFGNFAKAGFRHDAKTWPAAPNGVSLEPDGKHILVADIHTGAIYRTNIATETTTLVHQHPYAVNTAVRDSTGAIWFTQSTRNRGGAKSEEDLTKPFNTFVADGALFRMPPPTARRPHPKPRRMVSGLCFANGVVLDEARGALYVNESCANRVNAFRLSVKTGKLSHRRAIADVLLPDNIEIDARGTLWVASLVRNEILTIDASTGEMKSAFRAQTADNDRISAEWRRRSLAREPLLDLFTPSLWAPLPAPVTGIILSPGDGPAYVSGLGDTLVKLDPRPKP
jgi:sugar lactone lactonase YvrE